MKIARFTALRQIEIADAPEPRLVRPDDVRVRIDRVGVCGSDVHYYVDGHIGSQVLRYPATLGHECAGTVVEVGPAAGQLAVGARVAIDPAFACGTCDQCRAGRANTCRNLQFMGNPGEAPGAVAQWSVVPAANCVPIPDSMSLDQAVLVEPLSISLYATRLAQVPPGARVAVLGVGPIGLGVLLCLKAAGPCTVYTTDRIDRRLEVARRCGADAVMNVGEREGDSPVFAGRKPGQSPAELDFVFECSGDPECIDAAQRLLAPGGTLVIVGIQPTDRASFDPHRMRRSELTFKAVRRQKDCVEPMVRMVSSGRLDPSPMLTHRFPLERIRDAFELVAGYRDGVVKAVLDLTDAE